MTARLTKITHSHDGRIVKGTYETSGLVLPLRVLKDTNGTLEHKPF